MTFATRLNILNAQSSRHYIRAKRKSNEQTAKALLPTQCSSEWNCQTQTKKKNHKKIQPSFRKLLFLKIKAQPQLNQNMNASLTWTVCKWTVLWSGYKGNRGQNSGLGTWAMGVIITISPHSCHFEPPLQPPPPPSPSLDFDLMTCLDPASTIYYDPFPKGSG